MLLIRSRTFWIFWSEIFRCRSGSSPDTLNLDYEQKHVSQGKRGSCGHLRAVKDSPGHPGILLHHTPGQVEGEVHGLEDVLD